MTRFAYVADRNAADSIALAAWMRNQRYLAVRVLPDGSVAALADLLYTKSIILGCHRDGWASRFCFEDRNAADQQFAELQSEDDIPAGRIARRYGIVKPSSDIRLVKRLPKQKDAMSFSAATYRVLVKTTHGQQVRRWFEICECTLAGTVRRVMARTPAIIGEGDAQDAAIAQAREEANRMLKAFIANS